jgi:hypothetical protein
MKCRFEHDGDCCNSGATQYMCKCKQPCDTIMPVSNADRIRAMSDEELAVWLSDICSICDCCAVAEECSEVPGYEVCRENVAAWLRQPVKDGEGE